MTAASTMMTAAEHALSQAVQTGVPLVAAPFAQLAQELGVMHEQVLERLRCWTEQGKLREISAIVEGEATDYESALVAGRVPAAGLAAAVAAVNAHPTVTHNYLRDHAYNLWFTIAVPRRMGLERTLAVLAREAGVAAWHPVRRVTTFKIGVTYDLARRRNAQPHHPRPRTSTGRQPVALSAREQALLRALQAPLPLVPRPFAELARGIDAAEDTLLAFGQRHAGGLIRRYAGTFNHRRLGIEGNGMVVWNVPAQDVERVGAQLATAPEVSHCYARTTLPDFPYNLYSMVHTADPDSCRELAAHLARQTGVPDFAVLFSQREFKKQRLRYFLPELDAWWRQHAEKECDL